MPKVTHLHAIPRNHDEPELFNEAATPAQVAAAGAGLSHQLQTTGDMRFFYLTKHPSGHELVGPKREQVSRQFGGGNMPFLVLFIGRSYFPMNAKGTIEDA